LYFLLFFISHCIACVVVEGKAIASTKALKVRVDMEYQSYTTPPAADKNKPVWGEEYVLYVQIREFFLFPLMYFFFFCFSIVTRSSAILKATVKSVGSVFIPFSVLLAEPKREVTLKIILRFIL